MNRKVLLVTCLTLAVLLMTSSTGFALGNVPVTRLILDVPDLAMLPGKTVAVTYTVWPGNATNKTVKWSSSNTKVAKVSAKGAITAVSKGKAVITAQAKGNSRISVKRTVTVISKITRIDYFNGSTSNNGVQKGTWWTNLMRDWCGIELNVLPSTGVFETQWMTMLASGDLPDICQVASSTFSKDAIKANLVTCLEDYKDRLPNCWKYAGSSLDLMRESYKDEGGGKLYSMPIQIGKDATGPGTPLIGTFVRWDLYKKLGMPKLKTFDDFIPMLKKMHDLEPKNENGKPVYGLSMASDFKNNNGNLTVQILMYSFGHSLLPLTDVNYNDTSVSPSIDSDSCWMRINKWLFKLNQAGLLDPECMTQNSSVVQNKADEFRNLLTLYGWTPDPSKADTVKKANQDPPVGFGFLQSDDMRTTVYSNIAGTVAHSAGQMIISSTTKNLDACLRFLNFMYSYEATFTMSNGPRGVIWDINKDGMPYVTKKGRQTLDKGEKLPGGGKVSDGPAAANLTTITAGGTFFEDKDTYNIPLSNASWSTTEYTQPNKLAADWAKSTGYRTANEMLKQTGQWTGLGAMDPIYYTPTMPDEMLTIYNTCADTMMTKSYLMETAKSQADFDSLYSSMVKKVNELGGKKLSDWYINTAWPEAIKKVNKIAGNYLRGLGITVGTKK